ncbi:Arp2/3 complex subunit [Magnaporthiopsis poae ATCC 64411]|uniref:Arp2/3 complex subunit n=1 Tax=Magnaporthiopsis poae (strain ATCC 64411 / 73-15) TaxID=644358 RepID=A0A0C4E7N8_MAGP6|nr:Arp2/3 complex subunit [Magnaporthiopsis poae ATCC 64411]
MSIIQQHTDASLSDAWRTINIDALTEDSCVNFDTSTLRPPQPEVSEAEARQVGSLCAASAAPRRPPMARCSS